MLPFGAIYIFAQTFSFTLNCTWGPVSVLLQETRLLQLVTTHHLCHKPLCLIDICPQSQPFFFPIYMCVCVRALFGWMPYLKLCAFLKLPSASSAAVQSPLTPYSQCLHLHLVFCSMVAPKPIPDQYSLTVTVFVLKVFTSRGLLLRVANEAVWISVLPYQRRHRYTQMCGDDAFNCVTAWTSRAAGVYFYAKVSLLRANSPESLTHLCICAVWRFLMQQL